ncbi:unnamed protein product [Darwinula stevensoni]|uniref:Uncharacterized protein n=1 Tax=Darwinula stevensoni TaxID=69355 RepID=A0A7R8X2F7_9CRUS|nr:unnamed protein product [Darwinula stevensoni]CAG0883867.1 unnamed protein product [Darwinula stevensoni]
MDAPYCAIVNDAEREVGGLTQPKVPLWNAMLSPSASKASNALDNTMDDKTDCAETEKWPGFVNDKESHLRLPFQSMFALDFASQYLSDFCQRGYTSLPCDLNVDGFSMEQNQTVESFMKDVTVEQGREAIEFCLLHQPNASNICLETTKNLAVPFIDRPSQKFSTLLTTSTPLLGKMKPIPGLCNSTEFCEPGTPVMLTSRPESALGISPSASLYHDVNGLDSKLDQNWKKVEELRTENLQLQAVVKSLKEKNEVLKEETAKVIQKYKDRADELQHQTVQGYFIQDGEHARYFTADQICKVFFGRERKHRGVATAKVQFEVGQLFEALEEQWV